MIQSNSDLQHMQQMMPQNRLQKFITYHFYLILNVAQHILQRSMKLSSPVLSPTEKAPLDSSFTKRVVLFLKHLLKFLINAFFIYDLLIDKPLGSE